MLSAFRGRGFSSVVFGGLIVVIVVVFIVQFNPAGGPSKVMGPLTEQCAVRVKGHCVGPKDHRGEFMMLVPRDQAGNRNMKRAQMMGLPRIALDGLIERELLVAEAERIGLTVTEDEVTEYIYNGIIHVSVPSDKPELTYSLMVRDGKILVNFRDPNSKQFDLKTYNRQVKYLADRSAVDFRAEQEREVLAAKMRDLVRAPVRVSEGEALETYIGEKSQATLSWVEVKQSYVARYALAPTQAEIDAFATEPANEKELTQVVEQRKQSDLPKPNHVRHMLVKVDPKASAAEREQALAKISAAYWRIKNGEGFAHVAREVGQDGTASSGGDLGDHTEGFVPAFRKVADALKPGEMTEKAVETQFGYHLIVKDDPSKTESAEAQIKRDAAREMYLKAKSAELTREMAKKIGEAIKNGSTAEDAVKAQIATLKPLASAPALMEVLADETLAEPDGGAADAGAEGGAPPKKATITAETDPDRPQVTTSAAFNRGGTPIAVLGVGDQGKAMDFAFGAKDGEVMAEPLHSQDGFVVVQLKEHKIATREDFDKERDTYMQTLLAAKQQEALVLYVRRLKDASKADVSIDEKYMDQYNPKSDAGAGPIDEEEF